MSSNTEQITDAVQAAIMFVSRWLIRTEDGQTWVKTDSVWEKVKPDSLTTRVVVDTASLVPWGTNPSNPSMPYPLIRLDKLGEQRAWANRIISEVPVVKYEDLNSAEHALWLNTPAGEVWVGSGDAPEPPQARWTYEAAVSPQAGPTPMWDAFMAHAFDSERERDAVTTVLGLMLRGEAVHSKVVVSQGAGGTGKTTLFAIVSALMGSYASGVDANKLSRSNNSHEEWIAELVGKRLVVVEELPDGTQLNAARLKMLMSGAHIESSRKGRDRFGFDPQFTFAIATNELPNVATSDSGIKRRLSYIKMENVIPLESRYPSVRRFVAELLASEGPQVMAKLIEASRTWDGDYPQVIGLADRIDIENQMSGVATWLKERCAVDEGGIVWTPTQLLHEKFVRWAQSKNHADQHISIDQFGFDISVHTGGLKSTRRTRNRVKLSGWPISMVDTLADTTYTSGRGMEDWIDPNDE